MSVRTWTGEFIGNIINKGYLFKDNFGGTRLNIRVSIGGTLYYGTIYNGMYCRLKKSKKGE